MGESWERTVTGKASLGVTFQLGDERPVKEGKSLGTEGTGLAVGGDGVKDAGPGGQVCPRGPMEGVTVGVLDGKHSGRGMWDLGWVWCRRVC